MKIMIESTEQLTTTIDSVRVRVWKGTTEGGVECFVFVHGIAVHKDADSIAFDHELLEMLQPRLVPLSEVLV